MIETKVTTKLVQIMRKKFYAMVLSLHGHEMQQSNWPDLYIAHWRYRGFIECKGAKTELRKAQISTMDGLIKRGDNAYVLRYVQPKFYRLSNFNEEELIQEFRFDTYHHAVDTLLLILQAETCP